MQQTETISEKSESRRTAIAGFSGTADCRLSLAAFGAKTFFDFSYRNITAYALASGEE